MTKDEHVAYWLAESDKDLVVMHSLFANGHYTWALFVGHLALEKSLKALFAARIDIQVPPCASSSENCPGLRHSVDQRAGGFPVGGHGL